VSEGLPTIELAKRSVPATVVPISNDPDWVSVDFATAGVQAIAGEPFAIVMSSGGASTHYYWYAAAREPLYTGGKGIIFPYEDDRWIDPDDSYFFKQYVLIPEPSALALSLASMAAFYFRCFCRRRTV
jgi:hypothetical protein